MTGDAIEVRGLVKRFGADTVVDGLDLAVPTGRVLALLGANGAGKTTTVRMLATLLRPDGGTVTVNGFDVVHQAREVRRCIGVTGQYASVDVDISGWENLYMIGRLVDLTKRAARARADELLEQFDLGDAAARQARHYSGGMRRRLDLAASLVGRPAVIYLDEPTTGLDPRSRNGLWDIVRSRVADGATVLLTTQYMEEAEALADLVTVMDHGRLVASGTPAELQAQVGGEVLRVHPVHAADVAVLMRVLGAAGPLAPRADLAEGVVSLPVNGEAELTTAIRTVADSGVALRSIDTHVPDLDEVFLALTDARRPAARAATSPS